MALPATDVSRVCSWVDARNAEIPERANDLIRYEIDADPTCVFWGCVPGGLYADDEVLRRGGEFVSYGDHVYAKRKGYTHHGVEVADGMVIHFAGTPRSKRDATIRRDSRDTFADGRLVRVQRYERRLDATESVRRAESKLGESGYNLYANNCEHFARWCVIGKHGSSQVAAVTATGGVVASSSAATAGGVGVVGAVGAAAGLSGPGIMSGLATVGGLVGSGAVGGLVVLGVAPGAMSAAVMNIALRDGEHLPAAERSARGIGRKASIVGVAGGSAAGVATVSAVGVTAGLSGAGISSGLAAIGGVVGGGMAVGSAIVIAAPAVAAAGIGYGAYRATRWLRRRQADRQEVEH